MKNATKGIRNARSIFDDEGVKILRDIRSRAISIQQAKNPAGKNEDGLLAQADAAIKSDDMEKARELTLKAITEADGSQNIRDQILARLMMMNVDLTLPLRVICH